MFEWFSTIFFLIGAYFYTGKKASNPKIRINSFYFYIIGAIIFITLNIIYELYPFAITQIIFSGFDIRGIINCRKEIKNLIGFELPDDYYGSDKYNEED